MMKKILLIEDEINIQKVYASLLKKSGFEVETADNGIDGLDKAQKLIPDLIILDLILPKLDGELVLEGLKEDSSTADIPVLIISAKSDQESIEKTQKMGAEKYMVKPIEREELLTAVKIITNLDEEGN